MQLTIKTLGRDCRGIQTLKRDFLSFLSTYIHSINWSLRVSVAEICAFIWGGGGGSPLPADQYPRHLIKILKEAHN